MREPYFAPNGDEYRYEGEWYGLSIGRPVKATQPVYVRSLRRELDINGWTLMSVCKRASGRVMVTVIDDVLGYFVTVERSLVTQNFKEE